MNTNKRIVVSSDHADIELRKTIAAHVAAQGWDVIDIGPMTSESTHYPIHGEAAAQKVASGECQLGIIVCGTGQGIMMAANKVKGIRCGVCSDTFSARMIRQHNDANVLCLGARMIGVEMAFACADAFLHTEFTPGDDGRHRRRVQRMMALAKR